jgi:hypothetical protein
MATEFFKDGNNMGLRTSARDYDTFLREFCEVLATLIEEGCYRGDWLFQLSEGWMRSAMEIGFKLKGYKADVVEQRVIIAGNFQPADLIATLDERGKVNIEDYVVESTAQANAMMDKYEELKSKDEAPAPDAAKTELK